MKPLPLALPAAAPSRTAVVRIPLLRHPGAWLPLLLSALTLACIAGLGNGAHASAMPLRLLQLLLLAQAPPMAWLAFDPRTRGAGVLPVLGCQAAAWLVAALAVLWFNL